ncbi:MAG: hypothetical protein ACR2MY_06950 [Candidatus Dormibacteria bacterium]
MTVIAAGTAMVVSVAAANAATGAVKVDRQAYHANTPVSPYSDSNLHVAVASGKDAADSFVHLDFGSVPKGSQLTGVMLDLTESSAPGSSANPQAAQLKACVLTQELKANYTSSQAPPAYECNKGDSLGSRDSKGHWHFNFESIVGAWERLGNTGAAIIPIIEPPPLGAVAGTAATSWSLTLDSTASKATATYTPAGQAAPAPADQQPVSVVPAQGIVGLAPAPFAVPPPPLPGAAPPANPAPAPSAGTAQQATIPSAPTVVPVTRIETSATWLRVAGALVLLAFLLLGGAAVAQVARQRAWNFSGVMSALDNARSQIATPVAVILVGAVLAGGFASRAVSVALPGQAQANSGALGANGSATPEAGGQPSGATALPGQPGGAAASGAGVAAAGGPGAGPGSTVAVRAAGTAANNCGPQVQGVTCTTVRIGFFDVSNTNAVNQAAGINGLNNLGSPKDQQKALVDWINKHGGIAGRLIDPQWVPVDGSNQDPNYPEQLCKTMTEDYKVFAVVDGDNEPDSSLQCYVDHKVLLFTEGLNQVGARDFQQWAPYFWSPSLPSLDRGMEEEIQGLAQKGFFSGSGHTVGYVYPNLASTQRVIDSRIKPDLARLGYSSPFFEAISVSNAGQEIQQAQAAALKFKTEGVDRVFFVNDYGAAMALYFMRGADGQHYTPKYGLQSADGLDATAYLEPASQLTGAIAVGYLPWADTSTANSDGFPGSAAAAACYKIMNDHGIATPNPPGRDGEATVAMTGSCDGLFLLYYGAANLGNNLNATSFAAAAERLGASYQDATGYEGNGYIGPAHHDAVNNYRFVHWDPSCTNGYNPNGSSSGCWKLDNRTSYRSPEV